MSIGWKRDNRIEVLSIGGIHASESEFKSKSEYDVLVLVYCPKNATFSNILIIFADVAR